jgi:N6-adenosine-specific RNA methylase IME4
MDYLAEIDKIGQDIEKANSVVGLWNIVQGCKSLEGACGNKLKTPLLNEERRAYAKAQRDCAKNKLAACRKIGGLIPGEFPAHKHKPDLPDGKVTLETVGISYKHSMYYQELASIPQDKWDREVEKIWQHEDKFILAHFLRLARKKKAPTPSFPTGTFGIILADPPWQYEGAQSESRTIEGKYPSMPLKDICELEVNDIAAPDCVLFLWATSPKLPAAFEVIKEWGFEYRTCAVWDKEKIGMGYYFRQQHELLLVGRLGGLPLPEPENRPSSVIQAPRGKHSAKPEEVYTMIECMYPDIPKIELFSRTPREGWEAWGSEA